MKLRLAAIASSAVVVTSLAAAVTPTGAASANTAPAAPAGLTVDDMARPLNTDLTPRFGWLPQDSDANEVQSAYKIEVRDAAGEIVWDSRKVTSAQQSYVDYAGEKLEPGSRYTWRVMTWDRGKQPSRWSAKAAFETGLGDTDWSGASWIRRPPGTADNPAQERDEWTLARTEIEVPDGRIVRARSYLAASHTAELYLGGEQADRMSNFGYPSEGYYQAADVTDLVTPGETLALGLELHWFSGGQGRAAGIPGVLLKLVLTYADGETTTIVTDGSWKVRRGPYVTVGTRNGEGLWIEHLDGQAAEAIGDWTAPGYDDAAWSEAVVLGQHPVAPFTHLEGQQTRLEETVVHPERILRADDGTPVADFGTIIPARPGVHFDQGTAGRQVPIRAGYELADTGRVSTTSLSTQSTNMSFPYTQAAGAQDYQAVGHLGFRYLEIPGAGEEITAEDVTATVVHSAYDEDGAATFESSDETLDAVWDLMDRSLRYSVQETFVDTPTREQGQFLHDTANISVGLMSSQRERVASRQAIPSSCSARSATGGPATTPDATTRSTPTVTASATSPTSPRSSPTGSGATTSRPATRPSSRTPTTTSPPPPATSAATSPPAVPPRAWSPTSPAAPASTCTASSTGLPTAASATT